MNGGIVMFQVNRDICIACKQCIKDCPTKVITLEEGKAEIHNDWGCIKCGHCLAICPVFAISTDDYDMGEVIPYEKEKFEVDPDQLLRFIKFRRSVRRFKDKPVEKEKIEQIIEAGRFTQTSTNNQDVSYIVIQDQIDEVRRMALDTLKKRGEEMLANMTPETEYLRRYAKAWIRMHELYYGDAKKDRLFFHAPAVILVTTPTPLNGGLASSNMELMIDALGLGTFFSGFFITALQNNQKLKDYLGITEKNPVVSCIVLGYPDVKYQRSVPRKKPDIRWI